MSACTRCQRSDDPRDWRGRADVVKYGLNLCYSHEIDFMCDIDDLSRLDASDPERAHGIVDDVLIKWAPRPLAEAVIDALDRQPWVAGA